MHDLPIATHWCGVSLLPADLASFDSVTSDYQDLTAVSFFFLRTCTPISMVLELIYIPTSWVHITYSFSHLCPYQHLGLCMLFVS